jgi:hypothetical protein
MKSLPLLLFLSAVLVFPSRSSATSVTPPAFDQLVSQADYIVRAVVKSVHSELVQAAGQKHISTKVELDVKQVIAGTPPQPLVLIVMGGRVGNLEMVVQGAPTFAVGDENIFFVRGNGQQFYPLVAIMHGVYPVYHDAVAKEDFVLRSNGDPLYNAADVALPMAESGTATKQIAGTRPISVAEFSDKIKVSRQSGLRKANEN